MPEFDWEVECTDEVELEDDNEQPIENTISLDDPETRSTLSEISGIEELPSDENSVNRILKQAMETMSEFVKRGRSAAKQGIKATYHVKVGEKRSRRTEQEHAQKMRAAEMEGLASGNPITKWFKFLPRTSLSRSKSPIVPIASGSRVINLREEEEESSGDEPTEINESEYNSHSPPLTSISPSLSPSLSRSASPASRRSVPSQPRDYSPIPSRFSSRTHSPAPNLPTGNETLQQSSAPVDDDNEQPPSVPMEPGAFQLPPDLEAAGRAYADIKKLIKPPRDTGVGYKDPNLDLVLRGRLELMKMFLWQYLDGSAQGWIAASLKMAHAANVVPG